MASSHGTAHLEPAKLKALANAAAGHDGVMCDELGELVIKPCTAAEIDFYQESAQHHAKFYELMPTFVGTLQLGAPAGLSDDSILPSTPDPKQASHSPRIATDTAIVLENLEHGFRRPNVLDLKLGARLYADGTPVEKAERLERVAAETTSGSLHFRIAGMKVWNGREYDVYDKLYGRSFTSDTVKDGFAAFFASLATAATAAPDEARELLETVLAEITKARHSLERSESRMYSSSLLVVYEGDADALGAVWNRGSKTPLADERAPTRLEIAKSVEDEEDEEEQPPVTYRVKMIDFAHAAWTPGHGRDENVIRGIKNIEQQMDLLIARFQ